MIQAQGISPQLYDFASNEEKYFYWYLEELIDKGFVARYKYQPKPFILSPPAFAIQNIQKAKKTVQKSVMIVQGHEYQADFIIYWTQKAKNTFYVTLESVLLGTDKRYSEYPFIANAVPDNKIIGGSEAYSVIDVKGNFNQNDSYRRFSIDQKMVLSKLSIYVQKIITAPSVNEKGKMTPSGALFPTTFTPKRYLFTDINRDIRKIRFPVKTIDKYLSEF